MPLSSLFPADIVWPSAIGKKYGRKYTFEFVFLFKDLFFLVLKV